MKRIFAFVLAALMLFSLCACKGEETDAYAGVAGDVMSEHSNGSNSDNVQLGTEAANEAGLQDQTGGAVENGTADQAATGDAVQTDAESQQGNESAEEQDVEVSVEEPVEEEPKITNPLTGIEIAADISSYRPYAIMIDNGRGALPQDGISYADILYEVTAYAGGATRCMGIFQDLSVTDFIGGVRSCRSQFVDIALSYDAIYIHYGGSDEGKARIYNTDCDHIDGMSEKWLYRDDWRIANIGYSHSVVVDTENLCSEIGDTDFRLIHEEGYSYGLSFDDNVEFDDAQDAVKITICIGGNKNTDFEYDADAGLYKAYQYGNAWVDRTNEQQLAFTNLVFIHMDSYVSKGEYQIHETLGTGTGYYLCNGKLVEITWSRETLDDPYQYFYTDGTPVALQTGKTYIGVYTAGGYVEWEGPVAEAEAEPAAAE